MKRFHALIAALLLGISPAWAGLPPTTGKVSGDSTDLTTFKYRFPYFAGTHTGTILSLGVLSVTGGGTGADLSATGGASQVLFQTSSGGAITVARPTCSTLSDAATSCSTDATNAGNISAGNLGIARLPTNQIQSKTANYTTVATDDTVIGSTNGGAFTITLVGASSATKPVKVCKGDTSTNALTISRGGSDVIQSSSTTVNSIILLSQGECVVFTSDTSTKWYMDTPAHTTWALVNNGPSGNCAIASEEGNWLISGGTKVSTGWCAWTIRTGAFSAKPACNCVASGNAANVCATDPTSATAVTIYTNLFNGSGADENNVSIICRGSR